MVKGYNSKGPEFLGDHRVHNQDTDPLLNDIQLAQLWQVLQSPPGDGGLWNGRKVADWMSETLGRKVSRQRGWEYLKSIGYRFIVPRPEHSGTEILEQEEWKKKLHQEVKKLQKENPEAEVEVWSMDEHRLGLKPVFRREWVDEYSSATAQVNWRFKWLWLYGFVHPNTGETYWWILPLVQTELFNKVLADFAEHFQIGQKKRVVLVIDNAGWHVSKDLKIPEGIHLYNMPAHSPELQPAERLWPLTNEPIANRTFATVQELEEVIFERCKKLLNMKELIRGLTNFYWWPQTQIAV